MNFTLKAYRGHEGVVSLTLQADDLAGALRDAQDQGYRVISHSGARTWRFAWRRKRFPLTLFSQGLLAMLEAGMNLVEAMTILAAQEREASNPHVSEVLDNVLRRLREGSSFADALSRHPAHFPLLYVAMSRASERTGNLVDSLKRYLAYEGQLETIRKRVLSAGLYPALLLGVGALVILFLLFYVVPSFSRVYEDLGEGLPWMSRALMEWGKFFSGHWLFVLSSGAALLAMVIFVGSRASARALIVHAILRLPAIAAKARLYQLARFYRTVGMLQRGGMPLVGSFQMADGLLGPELRKSLDRTVLEIQQGQSPSAALQSNGLTNRVADGFLRVGERSGELGDAMERIAAFYDDVIERWVDAFSRLFEPLLMVLIGLIVGAIVVLMYLPIFELAGSIQ